MLTIVLIVMGIMIVAATSVAYKPRESDERPRFSGAASDELQKELIRRRASGQMPRQTH